jgi:hypothetical protein
VEDMKALTVGIIDLISQKGFDGLRLLENATLAPLLNHVPSLATEMEDGENWNGIYSTVKGKVSITY